MKPVTIQAVVGILVALFVGGFIAFAGSHDSVTLAGVPVFALCAVIAFAVQWVVFIPSYLYQTEHFYDLTGGITYLSLVALVVIANPYLDWRGGLIALMVGIWAIRLSTFLFARVRADGFDRRFTRMKTLPMQFLMTWTLQGLWVL